jgi:hypothetical protein
MDYEVVLNGQYTRSEKCGEFQPHKRVLPLRMLVKSVMRRALPPREKESEKGSEKESREDIPQII